MYRRTTNTVSLLAFLITAGLTAAAPTVAQGVQNNETDIAFARRMATRLERVEKQAERFEEMIRKMGQQASRDELTRPNDPYGQQDRIPRGDPQSDYRRAGMKMRSTRTKAGKEREKLADLQRSGGSFDPSDRDRIEATVSSLERSVADMEHDIRLRRF
jgi:hypothetical protein